MDVELTRQQMAWLMFVKRTRGGTHEKMFKRNLKILDGIIVILAVLFGVLYTTDCHKLYLPAITFLVGVCIAYSALLKMRLTLLPLLDVIYDWDKVDELLETGLIIADESDKNSENS